MFGKIRVTGAVVAFMAFFCVLLVGGPAVADLILDQHYDDVATATSTISAYNHTGDGYRQVGQTFTPTKNNIAAVELYLANSSCVNTNVDVAIFAVDASHIPTGTALVSASKLVTEIAAMPNYAWYTFTLAETSLTPGTEYAIIYSVSPVSTGWTGSIGTKVNYGSGVYAGGAELTNVNGTWSYKVGYDNLFRTYAEVPEPATMGLVVIGLAAVCGRKRLRK